MRLLDRGAALLPDGRTRFSVWAPKPRRIELCLRHGCRTQAVPLARGDHGVCQAVVGNAPAGTEYWYRLDGERDRPDPVSRHLPRGVHGSSRVVDPAAFSWTDAGWRGRGMADLVIYELHVGTFTPQGTFDSAIARLPALVELGVTAIELMPVAEFPGARTGGTTGLVLRPRAAKGPAMRPAVGGRPTASPAVLLTGVQPPGPEGNYRRVRPYISDRHRTQATVQPGWPDSDEVRCHPDSGLLDHRVPPGWSRLTPPTGSGPESAPPGEEIADAVHAQGSRWAAGRW
jgi:maltooligosyltrehalose trehalohydrolase